MAETDAEFVERLFNAASPASKQDPDWSRLFAIARRNVNMRLRRALVKGGSVTIDPKTIRVPDAAADKATNQIAKIRGCDRAVFSKCLSAIEAGVPCKCEEEARAAIDAGLAAWPGAENLRRRNGQGTGLFLPFSPKETDNAD